MPHQFQISRDSQALYITSLRRIAYQSFAPTLLRQKSVEHLTKRDRPEISCCLRM